MIALLTNTLIREPKTLTISDIKLISKYIIARNRKLTLCRRHMLPLLQGGENEEGCLK